MRRLDDRAHERAPDGLILGPPQLVEPLLAADLPPIVEPRDERRRARAPGRRVVADEVVRDARERRRAAAPRVPQGGERVPDGLVDFLSTVLGLDPDTPAMSDLTSTVLMTAVQNMTFLGDCSDQGEAKPETDIEFVFGTVIDELPNPLPGGGALDVTPAGAPPLAGGPYIVVGFKTVGMMHLDTPNRSFTLAVVFNTQGGTPWTNSSFPCDFYIGFNSWLQIVGSADASANMSADLSLTEVMNGSPFGQPTSGRAFVDGEYVVFVIPVSEIPGNVDEFLATLHTHAGDFFTMACADISGMVGQGHPFQKTP